MIVLGVLERVSVVMVSYDTRCLGWLGVLCIYKECMTVVSILRLCRTLLGSNPDAHEKSDVLMMSHKFWASSHVHKRVKLLDTRESS